MADDAGDEVFESADAGSSHTYPMEGGQIRKGGFIMIKGFPCKVSDVSTSKTGKHGHAKCHFVAIDIFTGKKMEDLVPASHTTAVPFVKKEELQCIDIDDEDFLTCLNADNDTRSDLKVNQDVPGADKLDAQIKQLLKDEKDFYVIVQSACGKEQIMDVKVMTSS
jgi:translation initiation factor 5A